MAQRKPKLKSKREQRLQEGVARLERHIEKNREHYQHVIDICRGKSV